jgi:Fe-S-cluster containining protein
MLEKIYEIYGKELAGLSLACREGCSFCCTQSVTMTSAEGKVILTFLADRGMRLPVLPLTGKRPQPVCTTNELAACCLAGREPPLEPDDPWVYAPCVFLAAERCTIYPARPFGCRSFASTRWCGELGIAEAPEWFVTLNIVVNQLVEHLDSGGSWGNMADVLKSLDRPGNHLGPISDGRSSRLLPTQPLPGFLIPPDEEGIINPFLEKVRQAGIFMAGR